jgi:uridylate kinase
MTRVMLKLSGEMLCKAGEGGVDGERLMQVVKSFAALRAAGIELAVVVGGGNLWRFRDNADLKIHRTSSDALGMMASIMNARLLQDACRSQGMACHAMAPHVDDYLAETYVPSRGRRLLSKDHIVVCGGGTGNPFFTTDSAAALRALELECDVLLKATKVDGVYDSDPNKNPDAKKFDSLTYEEVLKRQLGVMDLTAITLCMENNLPVRVFDGTDPENVIRAAQGENIGTLIGGELKS